MSRYVVRLAQFRSSGGFPKKESERVEIRVYDSAAADPDAWSDSGICVQWIVKELPSITGHGTFNATLEAAREWARRLNDADSAYAAEWRAFERAAMGPEEKAQVHNLKLAAAQRAATLCRTFQSLAQSGFFPLPYRESDTVAVVQAEGVAEVEASVAASETQRASITKAEAGAMADEIDRLRRFKQYVHAWLDSAGIPADPPGEHREAGCRVGQRLQRVADLLISARPETHHPDKQYRDS